MSVLLYETAAAALYPSVKVMLQFFIAALLWWCSRAYQCGQNINPSPYWGKLFYLWSNPYCYKVHLGYMIERMWADGLHCNEQAFVPDKLMGRYSHMFDVSYQLYNEGDLDGCTHNVSDMHAKLALRVECNGPGNLDVLETSDCAYQLTFRVPVTRLMEGPDVPTTTTTTTQPSSAITPIAYFGRSFYYFGGGKCFHVEVGKQVEEEVNTTEDMCNADAFDVDYTWGTYTGIINSTMQKFEYGERVSNCSGRGPQHRTTHLELRQDPHAHSLMTYIREPSECLVQIIMVGSSSAYATTVTTTTMKVNETTTTADMEDSTGQTSCGRASFRSSWLLGALLWPVTCILRW